jgi:general secretion pathway protein G
MKNATSDLAMKSLLSRRTALRGLHVKSAAPRAFTLVELLAVIVIIGILAAIILPVVGRVRKAARRIECVSSLRQIGTAIHLFAEDHKGILPVSIAYSGRDPFNEGRQSGDTGWFTYIGPYMSPNKKGDPFGPGGGKRILPCPESIKEYSSTDKTKYAQRTGYSFNKRIGKSSASDGDTLTRLTDISAPSVTPIVWDAYSDPPLRSDINPYDSESFAFERHEGTANILMVSGRVLGFKKFANTGTKTETRYPQFHWNP